MNNLHKQFFILFLFLGTFISAQTKTEKVWVNGDCGMCKERIETVSYTHLDVYKIQPK